MKKKIKCIFFDLDGTLVDSGPDLLKTLNHLLVQNNLSAISIDNLGNLVGGGAELMIKRGFKFFNKNVSQKKVKSLVKEFLDYYKENCSVLSEPYKGVSETLKKLKLKNICMTVCTNKKQELAEKVLKEFKLEKYFDIILGSSTLLKLKPHSEMLEYLINKVDFSSNEICMIGDSDNDIIPARKLNLRTIFVNYGYGEIEKGQCDFVIDQFSDIEKIILKS